MKKKTSVFLLSCLLAITMLPILPAQAQAEETYYTVTFDDGLPSVNIPMPAPMAVSAEYGSGLPLDIPSFDQELFTYEFRSWDDDPNIKVPDEYNPAFYGGNDNPYIPTGNTVLYASWTMVAKDGALVYTDAFGNSILPAPQAIEAGVETTISNVVPTRPGATFLGWGHNQEWPILIGEQEDDEVIYRPGDTFTPTENKMYLEPIWRESENSGTYNAPAAVTPDPVTGNVSLSGVALAPVDGDYYEFTTTRTGNYEFSFDQGDSRDWAWVDIYSPSLAYPSDSFYQLYLSGQGGSQTCLIEAGVRVVVNIESGRNQDSPYTFNIAYTDTPLYTASFEDGITWADIPMPAPSTKYVGQGIEELPNAHDFLPYIGDGYPWNGGYGFADELAYYRFYSWFEQPNISSSYDYATQRTWDSKTGHYYPTGNITYYPDWYITAKPDALIYWDNSGSPSSLPESHNFIPGEKVTISNDVPIRDGAAFLGWYIDDSGYNYAIPVQLNGAEPSGDTPEYQPGDVIDTSALPDDDAGIILFPLWQENENSGASITDAVDMSPSLNAGNLSIQGTFLPYNGDSDHDTYKFTAAHTDDYVFSFADDGYLQGYRVYVDGLLAVNQNVYDSEHYSSEATSLRIQQGAKVVIDLNSYGNGWDIHYTFNVTSTQPPVPVVSHTVTFDANLTSANVTTPAAQTVSDGQGITVAAIDDAPAGYTFLGWDTDPAALAPTIMAGDSFIPAADVTLYAIWSIQQPDLADTRAAADVEWIIPAENGIHTFTSDLEGAADKDWFYFIAPYTGGYSFYATGNTQAVTTTVYAATGWDWGTTVTNKPNTYNDVAKKLTGGTKYLVCVSTTSSAPTDYTINLNVPLEDEYANTQATADLEIGMQAGPSTASFWGHVNGSTDQDWAYFIAPETGRYTFKVYQDGPATSATIYAASGWDWGSTVQSSDGSTTISKYITAGSKYFVRMTTSAPGDAMFGFEITVPKPDDYANSRTEATHEWMVPAESSEQILISGDIDGSTDQDWFYFIAPSTGRYTFKLLPDGPDFTATVYAATGFDWGTSVTSRGDAASVTKMLTAGSKYYVRMTTAMPIETFFCLEVTPPIPDDYPNTRAEASYELTLPAEQGENSITGYADGSTDQDWFYFVAPTTGNYTFRATNNSQAVKTTVYAATGWDWGTSVTNQPDSANMNGKRLTAGSKYYVCVAVTTAAATDYTIMFTTPRPDDYADTRAAATYEWQMSPDPSNPTYATGYIDGSGDQDWFYITAPTTGKYTFTLLPDGPDFTATAYAATGWDWGTSATSRADAATFTKTLTAGSRYYVCMTTASPTDTFFCLRITAPIPDDYANTRAAATHEWSVSAEPGSHVISGFGDGSADQDWFYFTAPVTGTYVFGAYDNDATVKTTIYAATGWDWGTSVTNNPGATNTMTKRLTAGTKYYVCVNSTTATPTNYSIDLIVPSA
jgi:uncharacterized repeat protein (TIGR02543 family)